MKPETYALFTDHIIADFAQRFGLDTGSIEALDGFENHVSQCTRAGRPAILRLTHSSHRSPGDIQAELDWIDYLASHAVRVCRPLRSQLDKLVEVTESESGAFSAVVFERAPGRPVGRNDQTSVMTVNRGRLLGRIHALTKSYAPPEGHSRREHWHEADDFVNVRRYLAPTDARVIERFESLIESLKQLPTDADSYGLLHTDAHTGNLFFDGDQPTLFDFDDCGYDFFISDIAIALFYAILFLPEEWNTGDYARQFLRDILRGYAEENTLDKRWLNLIPTILKRREILLYVAIHRGFDMDNLDGWCQRYMDGRRERIEQNVPVLDIDFSDIT